MHILCLLTLNCFKYDCLACSMPALCLHIEQVIQMDIETIVGSNRKKAIKAKKAANKCFFRSFLLI